MVPIAALRGDSITLKNGAVYRGTVDQEDTLVSVFDTLKRIVVRDTKVAKIDRSDAEPSQDRFALVQPLEVHSGVMPSVVYGVTATPWDEFGRRHFECMGLIGPRSTRPVKIKMTQAINDLGPRTSRLRGVNGFWQAGIATSQIPKEVVLGILKKIDQKDVNQRLKVNRFLIQAGWYPEARAELERLAKDFPDQAGRAQLALKDVKASAAAEALAEIKRLMVAQRPQEALAKLRSFPTEGAAPEVLVEVRNLLNQTEAQAAEDKALAEAIRRAWDELPSEAHTAGRTWLVEMLQALTEAPDAVRGRFGPFKKAQADTSTTPEARAALALSGFVAGAEGAVTDLKTAEALWKARDALHDYLASNSEADRTTLLGVLQELEVLDPATNATKKLDVTTLVRIARAMAPPLRNAQDETPGKSKILRVRDDPNPNEPTEYAVLLPPEYHPLRSYPAVVALHSSAGPESAIKWWADEAAKHGFLVLAPEYNLRGQPRDYRYTPAEHAAVELALRDALKRFAIDPDRVFLGGQLIGANMAWDFGLAHPDQFAGVAIVSGLPAKYVWAYKANARRLPLYIAMGDLAPTETSLIFDLGKDLISRNFDVTYVEYYRRGLEDLPEEAPAIFDWMSRRRRDPLPKQADAVTARTCDDRFYGVVVHDFAARRAIPPEAADPLGKGIKPATIEVRANALNNTLYVNTAGLRQFDVWVSPKLIDFSKRAEVRVNGKALFKGLPPADLEPYLEDLRIRGDRQQVYALRVPVNLGGRP